MDFLGLETERGVTLGYLQQGAGGKAESFLCCFATMRVLVDLNNTV